MGNCSYILNPCDYLVELVNNNNIVEFENYIKEHNSYKYINAQDVNSINAPAFTLLQLASAKNHSEIIKILLNYNAVFSSIYVGKLYFGLTGNINPLHLATYEGNLETVEILLDKVPDIMNQINNHNGVDNKTALHYAIQCSYSSLKRNNSIKIAELLINKGCLTDCKDINGKTPLHYASTSGVDVQSLVMLLLSNGASIDLTDSYGKTCLHYAVSYDDSILATLLISKGANLHIKDHNGMIPLDYCIKDRNGNLYEENQLTEIRSIIKHAMNQNQQSNQI